MEPNPKKPGVTFEPGEFPASELWSFLAANIDEDPKGGLFRLFDQRLLIMRPGALADLQKHLEETLGLSSKGFLYLAGEKSAREGHALFERPDESRPASPDETVRLAASIAPLALLGWGRLELGAIDPGAHRFLVTLENSPIAEAYGESKRPVCHLLAGWVAGIAERVLGRSFLCEEMSCVSQGKPRCEFQLRPMPYP